MKHIVTTITVVRNGLDDCKHATLKSKFWKGISLFPLSHSQTKTCFICGRKEIVKNTVVFDNPFTFEAVEKRFEKSVDKVDKTV